LLANPRAAEKMDLRTFIEVLSGER
jgi:hypothetical protein